MVRPHREPRLHALTQTPTAGSRTYMQPRLLPCTRTTLASGWQNTATPLCQLPPRVTASGSRAHDADSTWTYTRTRPTHALPSTHAHTHSRSHKRCLMHPPLAPQPDFLLAPASAPAPAYASPPALAHELPLLASIFPLASVLPPASVFKLLSPAIALPLALAFLSASAIAPTSPPAIVPHPLSYSLVNHPYPLSLSHIALPALLYTLFISLQIS
jgi:hypothetical protein